MKAKVIVTGEIVDVFYNPKRDMTSWDTTYTTKDRTRHFQSGQLDFNFLDNAINWERRRYELVKAAMQGYCANIKIVSIHNDIKDIAKYAVLTADEVIKNLKGD